jgi:predicted PurR-regulated permease PerM
METDARQRNAYIATAIGLILFMLLCVTAFVIARPFIAPLAWGIILAIATWPVFTWCKDRLGGRRTLAALAVTLLMLACLFGPIAAAGVAMSDDVAGFTARAQAAVHDGVELPTFVTELPIVGPRIAERWRTIAESGGTSTEAREILARVGQWLLAIATAVGAGLGQLLLSILCAFFFFRDGEAAVRRVTDVLDHVVGARAAHLLNTAHGTLKGVVYGVLGAGLAQATLAAFGFWLAGVPTPLLLGLLTGVLGIVPGGPALIWLPASIWLFKGDQAAWGIFVAVWGAVLVGNIDNVIRPLFVSRGSDMPLLVILIGILGGAIAFGLIGVFLGPTILAIMYALMREWSPGDLVPERPA